MKPAAQLPAVGDKFRRAGTTGRGGAYTLYHVRAVVDDEVVVLRHYSRKRGWVYRAADLVDFELGLYERARGAR